MDMEDSKKGEYFLLYPLFLCLILLGLAIKPSPFRWVLWPLIATIGYHLFFYKPTDDSASNAILHPIITTYTFMASDYILLTDVQCDLRRTGQKKPIYTASFWARLKWALQLFFGPRGVGWNHEPKSALPPHPQLTCGKFLISQISWLAVHLLLIDMTLSMIRRTSFFGKDSIPTAMQAWHWQFLGLFLFALRLFLYMNTLHITLSIIFVAIRISEPSRWPPLFGRWKHAYTLRKFWGRTWHQTLRVLVSSHGKYLACQLGIPAGTNSSSYIQLYTAFLISGIIHLHPFDTRPLIFFLSQAVAITFEDGVIALAVRGGYAKPTRVHKLLGYIWVWCWFIYSTPPWIDCLIRLGSLEPEPSFGITDGALQWLGL